MQKILNHIWDFISEQNRQKELFLITKTLLKIISLIDTYTFSHIISATTYCYMLAESLDLSPADKDKLYFSSLLHDTGKIIIGKEIILKKTPLTSADWQIIKKHPLYSAEIIQSLGNYEEIANIIKYHHERFDGSGYPEGLKGENIPVFSRFLSVADSFEAMTGCRPYKPPLSIDDAICELKKQAGYQFDPIIVNFFIKGLEKTSNP